MKVVEDSFVALECDAPPANPPAKIQWKDNNGFVQNISDMSKIFFLNGGRFLYITGLNGMRIQRQYYCCVTNVLTGVTINSSISYFLTTLDVTPGMVLDYKPIGELMGRPGEVLNFVYAAGYMKITAEDKLNGVSLRCPNTNQVMYVFTDNGTVLFEVPQPAGDTNLLTITCTQYTADGHKASIHGTLTILGKYYLQLWHYKYLFVCCPLILSRPL